MFMFLFLSQNIPEIALLALHIDIWMTQQQAAGNTSDERYVDGPSGKATRHSRADTFHNLPC